MRVSKLDGLRGILCLIVVLYHFSPVLVPRIIYDNIFLRQSRCFVDFFFVLSGYVITVNYDAAINNTNEFISYVKKRFIRIYPLLLFTTIVVLFYEIIYNNVLLQFIKPEHQSPTSNLLLRTFDTLLFTSSTPILGAEFGMNIPSWSVSSEMISYLVFGVVALFSFGKYRSLFVLLIILLALTYSFYTKQYFSTSSFGFIRGLICFNLGYFVYKLAEYPFKIHNYTEILIFAALVMVLYQLSQIESIPGQELYGLFVVPLFFSAVVLILLKTDGIVSKILETKPFRFLGKLSYSIYLNHIVVIYIFPDFVFLLLKAVNIKPNMLTNVTTILCCFAIILIGSSYTQKLVEVKGSKFLNKLLFKQVKPTSKIY